MALTISKMVKVITFMGYSNGCAIGIYGKELFISKSLPKTFPEWRKVQ